MLSAHELPRASRSFPCRGGTCLSKRARGKPRFFDGLGEGQGNGNRDLDFHRKDISLRSENGAETTIIDCQRLDCGFNVHSGETDSSVIDGFTIRNGEGDHPHGCGIRCSRSSPTITNCRITANKTTSISPSQNTGMEIPKSADMVTR